MWQEVAPGLRNSVLNHGTLLDVDQIHLETEKCDSCSWEFIPASSGWAICLELWNYKYTPSHCLHGWVHISEKKGLNFKMGKNFRSVKRACGDSAKSDKQKADLSEGKRKDKLQEW